MIDKLLNQECSGCCACKNICPKQCIEMIEDNEGFSYPKINYDNCIKCNKCELACPILNKNINIRANEAYACISENQQIRLESSSGGVFSLIADYVLENNGVVFGAIFDENLNVLHSYSTSQDELDKLRRSKYVQSYIGDTYKKVKQFLEQDFIVLFCGTPCQSSGLKSFLNKDYENLILIDFICHGVPSPKVWRKYLEFQADLYSSPIVKANFRSKNKGWKLLSLSLLFKNNNKYIKNANDDLMMKAFLGDICLRPSCYECNFKGTNRASDITLADFWGIENVYPELDDDKGTSLVIVNSLNGKDIFNKIQNNMIYKKVDIDIIKDFNPSLIKSVAKNKNRSNFFNELDEENFQKLVWKYCSDKKVKKIIKKFFPKNFKKFIKKIMRKIQLKSN